MRNRLGVASLDQATMLLKICLLALLFFDRTEGQSVSSSASSKLDLPFTDSFSSLDHAACVSLFYRDGRVGCGTVDRSVQIGKLQYFDGDNVPDSEDPYVVVMEDYKLKQDPIMSLLNIAADGLLQGVLVLNSTSNNQEVDAQWFSPASLYPLGYGTPSQNLNYGNYKYGWNSAGTGILNMDFHGLPIAYVKDSDVADELRAEAQDPSSNYDIVAEFNYYMGPEEMNSADCLAWKDADDTLSPKCLPLGGSSVWATAGSPPAGGQNQDEDGNQAAAKGVFVVGAGMDSTSLFHDLVPGANSAASNILALLMAAKLVGELGDNVLDQLNAQIVFALFQAEAHGFVGSRSFFRDLVYPGFECQSEQVRAIPRLGEDSELACLNPLYPSLKFSDLGQIMGMIAVDQVGVVSNDEYFYVHADGNNDNMGGFLSNVLQGLSQTNTGFSVYESSNGNNGNGYPYPPTPLTSLLSLSGGAIGGAVLTGYDFVFSSSMPYHSFKETARYSEIDLNAIAASATIVARAAVAAAYDGGYNLDYETAAAYAEGVVAELDANDGALVALANCFLYNGECADIRNYAAVRARNEKGLTGFNIGEGIALGQPPNYYVGVYNGMYGQPFVQVGDKTYGRYNGEDFGKKNTDAIAQQPTVLENAIHGLLDDFLGRGTDNFAEKSCKKQSDCSAVDFCENEAPTCTGGGVCVCSRANFHRALDEALEAVENKPTGYFEVSDNDPGVSPIYTEPYWSNSVGVRVYRDVGPIPGLLTLVAGAAGMAASLCAAFLLRVGLKKEKLY